MAFVELHRASTNCTAQGHVRHFEVPDCDLQLLGRRPNCSQFTGQRTCKKTIMTGLLTVDPCTLFQLVPAQECKRMFDTSLKYSEYNDVLIAYHAMR